MEKFRILMIEDNDAYRKSLKTILQNSFPDIAIDEAVDGDGALQKVDAFPPDLIFMDINLPGENGLELTKKIKATHPNITIFIITSYDTREYQEAALQYGADRFFPKGSLNPQELEESVRSHLKG